MRPATMPVRRKHPAPPGIVAVQLHHLGAAGRPSWPPPFARAPTICWRRMALGRRARQPPDWTRASRRASCNSGCMAAARMAVRQACRLHCSASFPSFVGLSARRQPATDTREPNVEQRRPGGAARSAECAARRAAACRPGERLCGHSTAPQRKGVGPPRRERIAVNDARDAAARRPHRPPGAAERRCLAGALAEALLQLRDARTLDAGAGRRGAEECRADAARLLQLP